MTDTATAISLSAALIAGAAGSAHCLVMCGGLAGALGMRTRDPKHLRSAALRDAWMYHCGRLLSYATIGVLVGALGASVQSMLDLPALTTGARIAAALLIILAASKLVFGWNVLAPIERVGARYWKRLQPLARRAMISNSAMRGLLLGLLWGWLPCGLVYSMLVFAALGGDALRGGGIMLAFGLGTLPSMLASSVFAAQLSRFIARRGTRQLSGAMLLIFGIWLAWAALPSPNDAAAHHHLGHAAAAAAPPPGSYCSQYWTSSDFRKPSAPEPRNNASVLNEPACVQVAASTLTECGASGTGQPVRASRTCEYRRPFFST